MLHTVNTTSDSIEKILDHYTQLYSTGDVKILSEEQEKAVREALEQTDNPKLRQILEDVPHLEKLLSARVSRMQTDTLGFLGVIDTGPGDWTSPGFSERLRFRKADPCAACVPPRSMNPAWTKP